MEFDDDSLNELKRNHLNMITDIDANLKLFLTTRWQHAKKFTLPAIFDFDERDEVSQPMPVARAPFAPLIEERLPETARSCGRQMELLVRTEPTGSIDVSRSHPHRSLEQQPL